METRAIYAVLRRLPLTWRGPGDGFGGGRLFTGHDIGNTIVRFYAFVKFVINVDCLNSVEVAIQPFLLLRFMSWSPNYFSAPHTVGIF